jgi:predicted nucleic acid-binding protein
MNAVDTNIYVYTLDADEPIKQAKAIELLDRLGQDRADTKMIWQVAGELLCQLRRFESKGKLTSDEVEATFNRLRSMFPLRFPTELIFPISFELRSRHSLSHWDSMLIAACKDGGIDVLYSEDMADGADYDGVRIENPFA